MFFSAEIFSFPSDAEILGFDFRKFWTELESKLLKTGDSRRMSSSPSPPSSPVIYSSQRPPLSRNKPALTTSTPLTAAGNAANRKGTAVRRSLSLEPDLFPDDDFPEAALMSLSSDGKAASQKASNGNGADRSRQTNSQFKDDSSFLQAVMASSFGEIAAAADKKPTTGRGDNVSQDDQFPSAFFDISSFGEKAAEKSDAGGCNTSLYSATQLLGFLDKTTATAAKAATPDREIKAEKGPDLPSQAGLYSLDNLPPLKFGVVHQDEVDLFSDWDLGSPEFKLGSPKFESGSPEVGQDDGDHLPKSESDSPELAKAPETLKPVPEFKLPNLEDFELRSKTPNKATASHRPRPLANSSKPPTTASDVRTTSPEPAATRLEDSDDADSPIVAKRRLKNVALVFNSSSSSDDSPVMKKKPSG